MKTGHKEWDPILVERDTYKAGHQYLVLINNTTNGL